MKGEARGNAAEVAVSSLIIFIVIMITSTLLASLLMGITQTTMVNGREHAQGQSPAMNGITQISRLELATYNQGATGDQLYITFKMPYLLDPIKDEDVNWVLMCSDGASGFSETMTYSQGDFSSATTLLGSGNDAAAIDTFTSEGNYHYFITLNGNCDIEPNFKGTLILSINGGRTTSIQIETDTNPEIGDIYI